MMMGTNHYLLLDGAQIDGLAARLQELEASPSLHLLYRHSVYEALAEAGPLLVAVQPRSELARVFEQEWQATAGIWLESDANEAILVEHLRSLVHARVGGIDVLLRYYDPRITRPWLEHETTSQRDLLLGPIRRIRLPDDTPETCLERMSQPQPARYNDTPWVTLSQAQLEHMSQARLGEFEQRLLLHVRNFHPACLHNLGPTEQHQWLADCRASAASYGYSSGVDVARWASLLAELGSDFPHAPGHESYRALLAQPESLPSHRLDSLILELQRQTLVKNKESVA